MTTQINDLSDNTPFQEVSDLFQSISAIYGSFENIADQSETGFSGTKQSCAVAAIPQMHTSLNEFESQIKRMGASVNVLCAIAKIPGVGTLSPTTGSVDQRFTAILTYYASILAVPTSLVGLLDSESTHIATAIDAIGNKSSTTLSTYRTARDSIFDFLSTWASELGLITSYSGNNNTRDPVGYYNITWEDVVAKYADDGTGTGKKCFDIEIPFKDVPDPTVTQLAIANVGQFNFEPDSKFSIRFSMKLKNPGADDYFNLMQKTDGAITDWGISVYKEDDSTAGIALLDYQAPAPTGIFINDTSWHRIVWDYNNGVHKFYKDGILTATVDLFIANNPFNVSVAAVDFLGIAGCLLKDIQFFSKNYR